MARIHLDNVGLTFRVRPHGRITFKESVIRRIRQMFTSTRTPKMKVRALQNINLDIHDGERLGIIGHNGAGKSTLLKLLAGVYPPTRGRRVVEGRISSLFEIALGFELDATGKENIAYRGYLQGETRRSILAKMGAIEEFSELGNFLNMPVRYYSAGMMVRLAFSIATAINPEILLIDEVLTAGDLAFQDKARQRMQDMMAKARLIVLVSHDLLSLHKMCNKAIWMDHGRIRQAGSVKEVVTAYAGSVKQQAAPPAPSTAPDSSTAAA
ncbi:MAG: ABC transporter ATP-binding protein [Gemmataceae bacterium]|nr:ABC transporter ATP-binding protein [Gemmataceae bacterium]